MRSLTTALVAGVLAAACATPSPSPPEREPTGHDVDLGRVTAAVSEVAEAQAVADPGIATTLAAIRELDLAVARLRDPETVDAAIEAWPRAEGAVADVELAPLRPAIREIAFAVDRARIALAGATEAASDGWRVDYLAAQDETLVAMRAYAEAADALVQVLERHWPTYRDVAETTATFVEDRWLFRDAEEAAAAYEVAIAGYRSPLVRAQEEIARFRQARDDAARAVNDASAHAAVVFRSRPEESP